MTTIDFVVDGPKMFPTMGKRKKKGTSKMVRVSISYRTTEAVVEALEAFVADYNRKNPGASLAITRAVDMLVREALRSRGHRAADEPEMGQEGA